MRKKLVFLFFGFLLFFVAGCGGCGSEDASYSIGEGNYVILGPIEGAEVKIYRLPNLDEPIVTTKTGELGKFELTLPDEIEGDEILLVEASGGQNIDYDDDGFKDETPTPFKGKLHLICSAGDLRSGNVHVTVLSDFIYQYLNHILPLVYDKVSPEDFRKWVDLISEEFVNSTSDGTIKSVKAESIYSSVLSFNPLTDKGILKFDYDALFSGGESSLMSVYHKEDEGQEKEAVVSSFLANKKLLLNDDRLLNLRDNLKVAINFPKELVTLTVSSESGEINDFYSIEDRGFFVPKKETLEIKINTVKEGFKVIKWYGCDSVSEDLKTCFVNGTLRDRLISPVVVPETVSLYDDIELIDVTGNFIKFPNAENDTELYLLKLSSSILDEMEIYVDVNNSELRDKLKSLVENGIEGKKYIVVNKNEPVFYRKIKSISRMESDYRYKVETEFIKLTDVVKQGYISTQLSEFGKEMPSGVKLLSSSFILPDGTEVPVDVRSSAIVLKFSESGNVDVGVIPDTRGSWGTSWNDTIDYPYSYDLYGNETADNFVVLNGTIILKPYASFDMSWHWSWGIVYLDQVVTEVGSGAETKNTLKLKFKGGYGKKVELLKKPLVSTQVFSILGVPIKISERINFVCGIKGAGKGKDYDNATFEGSGTVNATLGVNTGFVFSYDGDGMETLFNVEEYHEMTGKLAAKANAFGYIGAVPGVDVYGFGIKMENDVGGYLKGEFEGSAASQDIDEISYNATFNAELGLGYYGLIQVYAEDVDLFEDKIDDIVDKINEKIRGKYTEFWKAWPILTYSTSWANATLDTAEEMGDYVPGILVVEGEDVIYKKDQNESFGSETVTYKLKNVGGDDVFWKLEVINTFPVDVTVSVGSNSKIVSPMFSLIEPEVLRGTLSPREEETVTIEIPNFTISSVKNHKVILKFYETANMTTAISLGLPDMLLGSSSPIADKNIALEVRPVDWIGNLTVNVAGTTKQILFNWTPYSNSDVLNGYEIHYCEFDNSTDTNCKDDSEYVFAKVNGNETSYEVSLFQTVNSGLLNWNKEYLFRIYGTYTSGAVVLGETYIPPSTWYVYGGKSGNTLYTPPSPEESIDEGDLNIFIVVDSFAYNDGDVKSIIKGTVEDVFASKPSSATLKVGIVLEDYYGPGEGSYILSLTEDKDSLLSAVDGLNFYQNEELPSIPSTLQNVTALPWEEGARKEIVAIVSGENMVIDDSLELDSIKQELLMENINLIGIGIDGEIAQDSPFKDLIDVEIPVSVVNDSEASSVSELQEIMLPPPVLF